MGDIVVAVVTEAFTKAIVGFNSSNLLSTTKSIEIAIVVVELLAVDPSEGSVVAEGSTARLRQIVGRPKRTGLTCRLESVWAAAMVEVLPAASYCCSVGSYLRLLTKCANHC